MGRMIDLVASAKMTTFRRTVIYGAHGWGKSTWAAAWAKPVFIRTEDGISHLDVDAFPLCQKYSQVEDILTELTNASEVPWRTLVIDSADWTEQLIWRQIEERHGVVSIGDIDYGRGYSEGRKVFRTFLTQLDNVRRRGMHIVVIAHETKVLVKRTDGTEYHQTQPKLRPESSSDLMEWADELLHADVRVHTYVANPKALPAKQTSVGNALGRVLYTRESPQRMAKSRLMIDGGPLPEQIDVPNEPTKCFEPYRQLLIQGAKK